MLSDLAIPFIFFNPCDVLNNLIDSFSVITNRQNLNKYQWTD